MNVNSDLGEGAGHDDQILPLIDSANVCCGVHAGSVTESIRTARRCAELGVQVGAHPSFDDRENYGRLEMDLAPDDLEAVVRFQVAALAAVARLGYLKAHGALYHYCQARPEAAERLARVAADFEIGVMGQPGYAILAAAEKLGVPGYREAFADRAYLADGRLAPRSQPGSVLDPDQAAEQALRLVRSGDFDSVCLHGDSPGAPATARRIREALQEAGIETAPLGTWIDFEAAMLAVGDRAPDLKLPSTGGEEVQLSEAFARNRATILAFYVFDFTPGWKTELTEFRSRFEQLKSAEIGLYGISVDTVFSHNAFVEQLGGLPFELLADFERKMVEAYGVRREDVAGYSGMPMRSIFIVDPDGVIRWTWVRQQGQPLPDYDEVIAVARDVTGRA